MKHLVPLLTIPIFLLAACSQAPSDVETSPTTPEKSPIEAATETCDLPDGVVRDDGATLILEGQGTDDRNLVDGKVTYTEGSLTTDQIFCALKAVGAPDAITTQMKQTRALDGRQVQQSGRYLYSWGYHPDTGLNVVVTTEAVAVDQ
jgi:hypothetical protein